MSRRVPELKQRESIFGPGAGSFLSQLMIVVVGLFLLLAALLLGVFVKKQTQIFLYGEPPQMHGAVAPGAYDWTPDKGLVPKSP